MLCFCTMARIKNLMVVPAGGWTYVDPDTGLEIHGGDYFDLRKKVLRHRLNNTLASGPELDSEIQTQICQRAGGDFCGEDGAPSGRSITGSDVIQFLKTLGSWLKADTKFVDQSEADRRAAICAGCPNNTVITGCGGCTNVAGKLTEVIGQRTTTSNDRLLGCYACGCSIPAIVWIPLEIFPPITEPERYVPYCWKLGS